MDRLGPWLRPCSQRQRGRVGSRVGAVRCHDREAGQGFLTGTLEHGGRLADLDWNRQHRKGRRSLDCARDAAGLLGRRKDHDDTGVVARQQSLDIRADLYETDSYVTLDLLARYDFGNGVRLNAGVFNLTGAEYIEWADVRGRAVGDPLIPYYTRPGRNASVTLHWRF